MSILNLPSPDTGHPAPALFAVSFQYIDRPVWSGLVGPLDKLLSLPEDAPSQGPPSSSYARKCPGSGVACRTSPSVHPISSGKVLVGDLSGAFSRRINIRHRLVCRVLDLGAPDPTKNFWIICLFLSNIFPKGLPSA